MKLSAAAKYIAKPCIPLNIGKHTIYVYPPINSQMNNSEKTYAFTTTKNALFAASGISFKTRLESLKQHTSSSSTIDVISRRFVKHAETFIKNQANIQVVSYHSPNGVMIQNTTELNNHLMPLDENLAPDRRSPNINYARLEAKIDFVELDPNLTTKYNFDYYVDLPMQNLDVTTLNGTVRRINTFHGPSDWAHIDQPTFETITLRDGAIGKPFYLKNPAIEQDTNVKARVDITTATTTLEEIALEAAWETINSTIYRELCPTTIHDPCAALRDLHQTQLDETTGEQITMTVQEFYTAIKNYTDFFTKDGNWPMDVVQHFILNLTEEIRTKVNRDYKYNTASAMKDAYSQSQNLITALASATTAEKEILNLSSAIKQHIQGNQGMLASVNISVAQQTIRDYTSKPITQSLDRICWGCGSKEHVYAIKNNIICPNKNTPGVKEKAEKVRNDFNQRRRDKNKKRKIEQTNKSDKRPITLSEVKALLSGQSVNNGGQSSNSSSGHVCFMINTSNNPEQSPSKDDHSKLELIMSPTPKNNLDCNPSFIVLNSANLTSKPQLPINFDLNLPHVNMPIGQSKESQFHISTAYDTCAVLNVGYSAYHLAIARKFPAAVKSLIWAKNEYSPITLTGIVGNEGNTAETLYKPTTTLPAIIEYHLPMKTKDGTPTSLKIALGNKVSVNTILGLSTIKSAKMSLDLDANVIVSKILDHEPFGIQFKPTSKGIPNLDQVNITNLTSLMNGNDKSIKASNAINCYTSEFKDVTPSNETTKVDQTWLNESQST